jgi:branched-chain amino acid transport system substrate-binding protein
VSRLGREGELGKRAREAGFTGTVLVVRAVGPAEAYPRGRGFVRRYQGRFGADPELFAANAYDATMVGLQALQHAIREQGGDVSPSPDVTKALRRIKHSGVTGEIEFDERGDLRNPTFMVYEIRRQVVVHARCARGACPCRTGACTLECCRKLAVPG